MHRLYAVASTPSITGAMADPRLSLRAQEVADLAYAGKDHRMIRDGELVTACQASCPTEAIVFSNINARNSRVAKLKTTQLSYGLLTELNTRPRTTYLARLRHPHPNLAQHEERG
jgi:hypothetical protein